MKGGGGGGREMKTGGEKRRRFIISIQTILVLFVLTSDVLYNLSCQSGVVVTWAGKRLLTTCTMPNKHPAVSA